MTLDEQDEIARPFGGSHKQSQGAGDALISEDDGNSFGSSVCESNSDEIKLSNEFSELKEQLREFKVELQKKKNEVKYLNEEKAYLEVQIKKVQDENSQLKTEVEELNKEKDGLYKQINQLNDKIAQLQNEISKSIDENACLKEKICKLEDNLERDTQIIKEQRVEIEEQRIEIKDFERENRRLKNKIKLQRLPIILCVVLGIATIVFGVLFANHVRLNNNKKREIVRLEQLSDSLQIIVDMKSNSVANDEEIQNLKGANKALQKVNDSLNKKPDTYNMYSHTYRGLDFLFYP